MINIHMKNCLTSLALKKCPTGITDDTPTFKISKYFTKRQHSSAELIH